MLGSGQLGKQPFHARRVERSVDFDGRVTGDRGGNPRARRLQVLCLLQAVRLFQHLDQHALQSSGPSSPAGAALTAMVRGPKGSTSNPLASSSRAMPAKVTICAGSRSISTGHEQPLPLHLLHAALAQDPLEQYPLMGHVLIDDPEALLVHRQDEGFTQLPQRPQRSQPVQRGTQRRLEVYSSRLVFGFLMERRSRPAIARACHSSQPANFDPSREREGRRELATTPAQRSG